MPVIERSGDLFDPPEPALAHGCNCAGAMGRGGEIFVLDMGEPVRIVDLARDMIRLSGLREGDDVEIRFTGLRPGEKLYEELYAERERRLPTSHPKIMAAAAARTSANHRWNWAIGSGSRSPSSSPRSALASRRAATST